MSDISSENSGVVLIIDDDQGARDLIGHMLCHEGYSVVTAAGGAEGLKLAKELRPVSIVLDVIMPDMDGWSVLQQLKSDPELADIPVVMATVMEEQSKGYVLGATDYLTKPLDRGQLATVLEKYLRDKEAGPILVVEDDEGTREITVWALEREDWQVDEAANGRQALEKMAARRPQLILLDLVMPEMDGFEFIDEFFKIPEYRSIPIVVVTAQDLTPEEGRFLSEHVGQVLQKGGHSHEGLMATIRDLLQASSSRRD